MGNVFLPFIKQQKDNPSIDLDGLEGYWRFEGNATDFSGKERHGIIGGNYNYVTVKLGQSLEFTGTLTTGSVKISDSLFQSQSIFSAFCWIYKSQFLSYENIVGNRSAGQVYSWIFCTGSSYSRKLVMYSNTVYSSAFVIPLDQWVFVGFTVKGQLLNLYANGENVGSFTSFNKKSASVPELSISGFGGNGAEGLNGSIDEVTYWSRELSANEVKTLYNNGNGLRL
ncbi:MAG: LamG domain-containing protein [Tannerella sp.]|jgi:hypothetical protein|nr:LamG domain-containing protein [Tannerella sp.]